MGQEIDRTRYSQADFQHFQHQLALETRELIDFAAAGGFTDGRLVAGLELEAWLLDHAGYPSPINQAYLARLANPLVVPELSRFNVELNSPPLPLADGALIRQERELTALWAEAQAAAHELDACLGMIGIPPTIRAEDLTLANMSALNRFVVLNEQVLRQRGGEAVHIHVAGKDALDHPGYRERYGVDNPNKALLAALRGAGVEIYLCGQTSAHRGLPAEELAPEVDMALSAMTVLVTRQSEGYALIAF